MQIFDRGTIYDFMGWRWGFFGLSLMLFLGSIFLLATRGLNYGIDFSGGTLIQVKYSGEAPIPAIRERLDRVLSGVSVTEFGSSDEVTIRYASSSDSIGSDPGEKVAELLSGTGDFEIRRVDVVGPKVGAELREKGIMAIGVSLVLILIYIGFRFEWRFALAAIFSEIHDVVIAMGFIALLGLDVNLDTLAAILTVLGYSLNDTIIVFDRIRERVGESRLGELNGVINESISMTLSRTLMTSITTLLVVVMLLVFGGDIIYGFSLIMLCGILIGTFSSVFVAAPMLGWFRFDINSYRASLVAKENKKREKAKLRAMYEQGRV